ncbi:MAG TPA: heme ABC exporter ATP-binding protein CcmA [Xanthobacteraceae bacterium]|nr:heme ABC exporter ATP-binding protein CcmA [Xanthobacteraceae bacterium]
MRLLAEGLGSMRGGRTLFQGLSFALHAGESLVVAGPNGSGKTTLLRLIAGLLPPTAGRITLADSEDPVGESVHFVGHLDALKGALTLGENLAFYRSLFGGGGDAVNAALGRMGIGTLAMLPAEVLSAGQRRRAALARLLVSHRPIWLLDEPANALDADGQILVARLMQEHRGRGGIVIAATHARLDLPGAHEISLAGAA